MASAGGGLEGTGAAPAAPRRAGMVGAGGRVARPPWRAHVTAQEAASPHMAETGGGVTCLCARSVRSLDGAGGEPGCPSPPSPQGPARGRHARAPRAGLEVRRARGERRGDRAPAAKALRDSGRGARQVCTRVPGGSHRRRSRCLGNWVGLDGGGRDEDDQGEHSGNDRRAPAQATGDDQPHRHTPQAVPGAPRVTRRTARRPRSTRHRQGVDGVVCACCIARRFHGVAERPVPCACCRPAGRSSAV